MVTKRGGRVAAGRHQDDQRVAAMRHGWAGDRVSCRGGSRSTSSTITRTSLPQNSFGSQQLIYSREAPKAESRLGPHRSERMEGLGSPPTLADRRGEAIRGLQEVRQGSAPCQSGLGYQGLRFEAGTGLQPTAYHTGTHNDLSGCAAQWCQP
jgi:hypothetical protein